MPRESDSISGVPIREPGMIEVRYPRPPARTRLVSAEKLLAPRAAADEDLESTTPRCLHGVLFATAMRAGSTCGLE